MIASGSSLRGLSEVTSTRSAKRARYRPSAAACGSRSPPAPNTTARRPPRRRDRTQRLQHVLERIGRVRVVDHHERRFADGCMRPGTGGSLASSPRLPRRESPCHQAAQHAEGIRDIEAPEDRESTRDRRPARQRPLRPRHLARRKAVADGAHASGEPPRQLHAERIIEVQHRGFDPGMSNSRAFASRVVGHRAVVIEMVVRKVGSAHEKRTPFTRPCTSRARRPPSPRPLPWSRSSSARTGSPRRRASCWLRPRARPESRRRAFR